jgi:serine/threonine protein kinase
MQQSSLEFFCDECGAANPEDATHCIACHHPLTRPPVVAPAPIQPVTVAPEPTLQVIAGAAGATPTISSQDSDALALGTLLQNRYKIEREIGRGGYSIVYLAHDTRSPGRRVAIKQINLRNLTPRQIIEATETFNRETTLLPFLTHPGIPRCYGHFTDPEHWYLVMEYIKGQTLEEHLQTVGCCSVKETLRIGIKLCDILEYLHTRKQPLIFRDIKPANILLTPNKRVYLIDFGIARTFNPSKTKDTTPLGSPGFAAPEQYGKGQSDQHTDIYGLGATLQTLLTGRDPLELRAGEPSRAAKPVPPHIQQLVTGMMHADPARRPARIADVKQMLENMRAQLYQFSQLALGIALSFAPWGWSNLIFSPQFSYMGPNLLGCLWFLAVVTAFVGMIVCAFKPTRQYLALGMLLGLVLGLLIATVLYWIN